MRQVETATVNSRIEFLTSNFGWREQRNVMTLTKHNCEFLNFSEVVAGLGIASRILLSYLMEGLSGRCAQK